jgi:hypothetical protein
MTGTTGKLERHEKKLYWIDLKAGSTGKLERPESWRGVNARTMESWKNGKLEAGSTGKLERLESWKSQIDLEKLA